MKSMLIGSLVGVVILIMVSSCATVPTEPPTPGEVRLSGVKFVEVVAIRKGLQYEVNIKFESDGQVEVTKACFYWNDSGPYCFNITDIHYGTRTIRVQVATPGPGFYVMKSYVHYNKDGRILRSNIVQTSVEVIN